MDMQAVLALYSQTCEQRPPKAKTEHGLYRQVVFIWRLLCFILSRKGYCSVAFIYRMVFIRRWPLIQVGLYLGAKADQSQFWAG